jgi:alpha-tubulin suppressor-like RCC1 family protein
MKIIRYLLALGILLALAETTALCGQLNYELWGMGYNGYGQLGDGTTADRNIPIRISTGVTVFAADYYHSQFVTNDGTLWGMGDNFYGEIGDGTTIERHSPVQIAVGVRDVATGIITVFLLRTMVRFGPWVTTTLASWEMEQRLTDTLRSRSPPVVSTAAAGYNHSLFLKSDGTLWAMGYNGVGQLGDGTGTQRNSPVSIASGVRTVAAGAHHSLFVKNDGTLWAMGINMYFQLGDGTSTDRYSPVQVATNVSAVAGGYYHSLFCSE